MISQDDAMEAIAEAVRKLPESDCGMSNFDHSIDGGLEEDLRSGKRGTHAAWDFNGAVWYDPKAALFYEAVRRYHVVVAIVGRPTLEELMREVNDEYGWE